MQRTLLLITLTLCVSLLIKESSADYTIYSYPCSNLKNLDCIRDYFASTGLCSKVSALDGEPIKSGRIVAYIDDLSITIDGRDSVTTFNGPKVESLQVNEGSGEIEMDVSVVSINCYAPNTDFIVDDGPTPVVVHDYQNNTYYNTLNAVIPNGAKDGISGTTVTSPNVPPYPVDDLGPALTQSSNPVIQQKLQAYQDNYVPSVGSILRTKSPFFFFVYLQSYICDFGYKYDGTKTQ